MAYLEYKFFMIMNKHAPLIKRKVRAKRTPWINDDLIIGKQHKNYLKGEAIKSQSEHDWTEYKVARNLYDRKIKHTIKSYYQIQLSKNSGNIINTWRTVNSILKKNNKNSKIYDLKSKTLTGDNIELNDFANVFNKHFIELGVGLSAKLPKSMITPESYLKDMLWC